MKSTFTLILLLYWMNSFAQINNILTPEQLKADADFYFETIYTNHPNPYYFYSLNEFEDKKNEIYTQLNKSLTNEQFAWIIGKINSCLDMHSIIQIYFSTHWRRNYFTDKNVSIFPNIRFKKGSIYLKKNSSEIKEINGIKTDTIIQDIKNYFNWKLPYEINAYSLENCFSTFLMYKYNLEAPFTVKFQNSDNTHKIKGYTIKEYIMESSIGFREETLGYNYKIYPSSSIAIFNITNFEINSRDSFIKKLNDFSRTIDSLNIQNIFYDLTMNGGGDSNVLFKEGIEALNIIKHDSIFLKLNKIERCNQFNQKYKVKKLLSCPNKASNTIPKERKLFILQGSNTKSAGDYFCRIVTENRLGILVGQNTGEPSIAFSSASLYTMPNSKIKFTVATTLWDYSDYFKEETLHPDVYWDVDHSREFSEEELISIIKQCKHIQQCTN